MKPLAGSKSVLLCALALLAACTEADNSAKTAAAETSSAAQSAFEGYVSAINTGDIERAAVYYDEADGFHWVERGAIQYEDGAGAAASLQQLAQMGGSMQMTVDTVRVAPLGPQSALLSAHFVLTLSEDDGAESLSFDGWMTV